VDLAQLILYHLLGYTPETVNEDEDEEDEHGQIDAAIRTTILRKEWGREGEWMEMVLSRFLCGGGFRLDV